MYFAKETLLSSDFSTLLLQVYLQVLAFIAFAAGCFTLSYGIDLSFESHEITHFIYFLFPFITTFPELTVYVYGLFSGKAGAEVAIGTALGEPFIVMTVGLLAYKLFTKRPLKMDSGSRDSLLTFIFASVIFFISFYIFRYASVFLILLFVVYEYVAQKAFKREKHESLRKTPLIYTFAGLFLLSLTGKYVVDSTVYFAKLLSLPPSLISFLVIPLISSAPEIVAPFVFSKRKEQEQIASLIAELPLTMSVYPGLLMLVENISVPFPLALGIGISLSQAVLFILEEKTEKNITTFTSFIFLALFIITLRFLI
jgi:Ca2+/Na+ antiporter